MGLIDTQYVKLNVSDMICQIFIFFQHMKKQLFGWVFIQYFIFCEW